MHIVIALNLWGSVVINMILCLFCTSCQLRTTKFIPVGNSRLEKYVFRIFKPEIKLEKKHLTANPSKKAKTVGFAYTTN